MSWLQDLAPTLVRGLSLLAILVLTGIATTAMLLGRIDLGRAPGAGVIRGWMSRLPGLVAWFLLTLTLIRGGFQVLAFTFPGEPPDPELTRAVLTGGSWGIGWMVLALGSFILVALMWLLREKPALQGGALALFCSTFILAQAGMGHGADGLWTPAIAGRLLHASHLVGAGIWLGTLSVLALAVFPSLDHPAGKDALVQLLRSYSLVARAGASLVVVASLAMTWRYAGSIGALATTSWGVWLMLKLAAFAGVMAMGWWNWRRITPRLERGDVGASLSLRQAATLELILGALVLAATTMLVVQGLPVDAG
jgi:putative copper resistance protein D